MFITSRLADTPILRFYRRYKCKYCGVKFIIMPTATGSALPVEVANGRPSEGEEFDSNKHVSHLLNCEKAAKNWETIINAMRRSLLDYNKKSRQEILR